VESNDKLHTNTFEFIILLYFSAAAVAV